MTIANFSAKSVTFTVQLVDGPEIDLTLRPYTLADVAAAENRFDNDDDRLKFSQDIANMKVDAICRLIWDQLSPESKAQLSEIKFNDYDEKEDKIVEVKVYGWRKLRHALASQEDIIKSLQAYYDLLEKNNFAPGSKKKTAAR